MEKKNLRERMDLEGNGRGMRIKKG